jgi:hypothetical protein
MLETELNGKRVILYDEVLKQARDLINLSKNNKGEEMSFLSGKEDESEIIIEKMYYPDYRKSTMKDVDVDSQTCREMIYKISEEGNHVIGLTHTHSKRRRKLVKNISINDIINGYNPLIPEKIMMTLFWKNYFIIYKIPGRIIQPVLNVRKEHDELKIVYSMHPTKFLKTREKKINKKFWKILSSLDIKLLKLPD